MVREVFKITITNSIITRSTKYNCTAVYCCLGLFLLILSFSFAHKKILLQLVDLCWALSLQKNTKVFDGQPWFYTIRP